MTVPHWRRSTRPERIDCDALVIGAGIAGVSAGLAFMRQGLDVRIIDRGELASGASSRNAGFLMRGCADHYADACRIYGRDRAAELWRLTEENVQALRLEGATALDSFRDIPSTLLALDDAQTAELRTAADMLIEDGFDVHWRTQGTDVAWYSGLAKAGLVNPGDASVNSWELMNLLARKLDNGIEQHQEVHAIEPASEAVRIRTPDFDFRAKRVLVCTNAYGPLLLPSLAPLITPRRGQMLAFKGARWQLDSSYYFNHGSEYFRQTPAPPSGDSTIVFGGCRTYHADRELGYEDKITPYVQADIEAWARRFFGSDLEITARWAGTMGFSPDGLPLVGPAPDFNDKRIWFCGGFTGHGMSLGYKTAHIAVDAMLTGAPNPFPLDRIS